LKAVILAGGFGTRLRPLSCTRPKILFPIVNKPLLEWTFERLAKNGVAEVILAVSHQTETFIKQSKTPKHGMKIAYSRDPLRKPLGTGGPIKRAKKLIGHDAPFLVVNGDVFADVNYTGLLKKHVEENALATIALHRVADPSRFGVAELAESNRIKRFVEKPKREKAPSDLINAGVYVFSPKIFEYIPEGIMVSLEREVFPKLAEEDRLYGYVFDGLWTDIGKPEDYLETNKTLLASAVGPRQSGTRSGVEIKKPVAFDKGVSLGERSVVGPFAVLGRNVSVGNSVRIQDSVIFPETVISDFSSIDRAIIGENVVIGTSVKIAKRCVVGDHAKIKDNVSLASGVWVCPAKEVSESVLTPKCIA
jgi:mannose-1-phosphate guanylyltransferase